jgi:pyrimidine-nucleoside phosphorylase
MRVADIIVKKRDGGELSPEELERVVVGYSRGEVPDEQAAAWCMAVYFRGMSVAETSRLTQIMAASGVMLDLHDVVPFFGDKHSTGGVGDTTTLVMGPMVAAAGLPLAKISGRGLAFTGGTLDKLESIPGCQVALPVEQIRRQLGEVGLVVGSQTPELAPADASLYALRDVTGTVPSFPLMASSIMSKKIVPGADAIVLDVKTGSGAFLPEEDQALELASLMMGIGRSLGRRMVAVIGGMWQPLGYAVGHTLEVKEAISALHGGGPPDLRHHCTVVAGELLHLAGIKSVEEAQRRAAATLDDGSAWARFRAFIAAQCGDPRTLDDPQLLAQAPIVEPLLAPRRGFVARLDARAVGLALLDLGGGRTRKGEPIDHAVGVVLTPAGKCGAQVEAGQPLAYVHARTAEGLAKARERLSQAYTFEEHFVPPPPVVARVLR